MNEIGTIIICVKVDQNGPNSVKSGNFHTKKGGFHTNGADGDRALKDVADPRVVLSAVGLGHEGVDAAHPAEDDREARDVALRVGQSASGWRKVKDRLCATGGQYTHEHCRQHRGAELLRAEVADHHDADLLGHTVHELAQLHGDGELQERHDLRLDAGRRRRRLGFVGGHDVGAARRCDEGHHLIVDIVVVILGRDWVVLLAPGRPARAPLGRHILAFT